MEQEEIIQTVDSNGTQLCHGDTVSVIKDLKVGGTKLTIKKGTVIPLMGLEDIAPLVAKLLGLDLPTAEGMLYPGILLKEGK